MLSVDVQIYSVTLSSFPGEQLTPQAEGIGCPATPICLNNQPVIKALAVVVSPGLRDKRKKEVFHNGSRED
jgi:hypothetical protein